MRPITNRSLKKLTRAGSFIIIGTAPNNLATDLYIKAHDNSTTIFFQNTKYPKFGGHLLTI